MQGEASEQSHAGWRSRPRMQRIAGSGKSLAAAVVLAAGTIGSLAARRRSAESQDENQGNADRGRQRGDHAHGHGDRAGRHGGARDRNARGENHHDRGSSRGEGPDRTQQHAGHGSGHDGQSAGGSEARKTPAPAPKNDHSGAGGGHGGGQHDTGKSTSDNALATKTHRHANNVANHHGAADAHGGIVFTSGPAGIEIHTDNITYIAAPTPTPTPFPRLAFPGKPGAEAALAATPSSPTERPRSAHADMGLAGDGSQSAPRSSNADLADTSGGDTTTSFTS